MAKEIITEISINASLEKIWKILMDVDEYSKWNPFIKSLTGEIKVGNKIVVKLQPAESKAMTFKPTVLVLEKEKEFRWIGRLLFPGIFDGEHKFELIADGSGKTTFRHSEKFKGILVPLLATQLDNGTKKGFEAMNKKIKELAEQI